MKRKSESGQAAVLLAMGLIGLLAFTALAIDGGNMYLQKRNAQNAADAASVAGTRELHRFIVGGPSEWPEDVGVDSHMISIINEYAQSNGVPDTDPDDTTVNANVEAFYLDEEGQFNGQVGIAAGGVIPGGSLGIEVIAHIPFDTFIAGLVGMPQAQATARAGSVYHQRTSSYFSTIYAGGTCTPTTLDLTGSFQYLVGGLHSNGTIKLSGNAASPSYYSGTVEHAGGIDAHNVVFDNPPDDAPESCDVEDFPLVFEINDYACLSHNAAGVCTAFGEQADQANTRGEFYYYPPGPGDAEVLPYEGLHYTDDPQGFKVPPSFPSDSPMRITLVTPHVIEFKAQTLLTPYVDGILLFSTLGNRSCPSNQTAIKLSGNRFNWEGLVYAPNGHVDMAASENSSLSGLIVAWTVSLSGAQITLIYNPLYDPPPPPTVVLIF